MRVLILEDNRDRRVAMISRLMERFAFLRIVFFDSAPEMVNFLQSEPLDDVALAALDHDLELIPSGGYEWIDPGTGLDAVDALIANVKPRFPVIVHSTNAAAASQMMQRLEEAGWNAHRVVPYGDLEWIDKEWFIAARDAILATAFCSFSETQNSSRPSEATQQFVWVFTGLSKNRGFPGAIFSEKSDAASWIYSHRLSGTLTRYPLNIGVYDWAISEGLFTPKTEAHLSPDFIGSFTTASQEHYHFEGGVS